MKTIAKTVQTSGKIQIASLVIVGVLFIIGGYFLIFPNLTQGASATSISDTLSDSAPGVASNHTIAFTQDSGTQFVAGETITLTFDTGFELASLSNSDAVDYDITVNATEETIVTNGSCSADEIEITTINTSTRVITFTACGSYTSEATGSAIVIEIGTNATAGGSGNSQIQNPGKEGDPAGTANAETVDIGGTFGDTGTAMVAIIEGVAVSVTIDETLAFSIVGQNAAQCADYDNTSGTEITTTTTTVPFGAISTEVFIDGCQELTAGTNGTNGYVITIQENDQLTSGGDQIADGTCDGSCTDSTEADWATSTLNGFAYCMEDITQNAATTADGGWGTNGCDDADTFFKTIADAGASEAAQNIMSSASAVSGDVSDIGYRISVDAAAPAGTYSNTVTFIATPTF